MAQLIADNIESNDALVDYLATHEAVLLLFGGAHCGVCQSIKPRLLQMLAEEFPKMHLCYIDCEQQADIAAAHRVFSLPVVELYFQGQAFARFVKVFAMAEVREAIARPYQLLD
ncbi:thioredoxin family protein [Shewanella alkalitolerans]|uniref:thioredoxin family protein n=1 Tax=Shewanella alkalitolerans TaxID=2864209 RepID=UPI001C6587AC|nr:thioredoxin family protein [Shewanella alkalitolerans]QYJ98151.1 thioredoxin family protein [Shewanella alkalitolerans]